MWLPSLQPPGEGRMVGGELRERGREMVTHPEAAALVRCPVVVSLGLGAANSYTWVFGCEALLARGQGWLSHRLVGWGWVWSQRSTVV